MFFCSPISNSALCGVVFPQTHYIEQIPKPYKGDNGHPHDTNVSILKPVHVWTTALVSTHVPYGHPTIPLIRFSYQIRKEKVGAFDDQHDYK